MDDSILVEKSRSGDGRAQKTLFDKYAPKMMAVCIRYMKDIEKAEDALQDGFVKVFSKLDNYTGEGSLEGWIRRVIVNTCLDQLRKDAKFKANVSMDHVGFMVHKDQWIIEKLNEQDLLKLVNAMPDGYRIVFNMFAIEGYSHKEIAQELGISENTSKSQFSRARAYLRAKLEELGIER